MASAVWGFLISLMIVSVPDVPLRIAGGLGLVVYWFLGCYAVTTHGRLTDVQARAFVIGTSLTLIAVTVAMFPYPLFVFMPLLFAPSLALLWLLRKTQLQD
jgi:hypothetical protein